MVSSTIRKQSGTLTDILQRLVENAPEGMVALDDKKNVVVFNRAAERIFGYSSQEAIGNAFNTMISDLNFDEGAGEREIVIARRKNGDGVPCSVNISTTLCDGSDFCTIILRDITNELDTQLKMEAGNELQEYRHTVKSQLRKQVQQIQNLDIVDEQRN